jgi:hypothetical protein
MVQILRGALSDWQFIIVSDLFTRYTVIVEPVAATTSVYCDSCETWVAHYHDQVLAKYDEDELLERIVDDHSDDFPTTVRFK